MSSPTQPDERVVHDIGGEAPSLESWLKVGMVAFVPLVLAFYLPIVLQPYLFVTGAVLVLCSMVMLVRQHRKSNSDPLP